MREHPLEPYISLYDSEWKIKRINKLTAEATSLLAPYDSLINTEGVSKVLLPKFLYYTILRIGKECAVLEGKSPKEVGAIEPCYNNKYGKLVTFEPER